MKNGEPKAKDLVDITGLSAKRAYELRQDETDKLIEEIQKRRRAHEKAFRLQGKWANFGYVGDLGHWNELLARIARPEE